MRATVALILCCASAAAVAQDAELEEIVVSAERRDMSLQNTPISIQALSAEAMETKGVEDISDVALFTPNLAINGSRGTGNNVPTFSIRGVSGGGGVTSERGVGLYIDDVFVPRTNGSVFKVFDLERVEVLRGPQGTLFGRNTEGGAIRLVTRKPTQEFEAYVKGTVGNFDHLDLIGMLNVPLNDAVALRMQVARLKQDGYVHRGPYLMGGSEDKVARAQLLWQFTDSFRMTVAGLYSDSESSGSPNIFKAWDMSPGINGPGVDPAVAIQGNYADWVSDWLQTAGQARLATVNDPRLVRGDYLAPDFCFLDDADPDWDDACAQRNDNKYQQYDVRFEWNITDSQKVTLTNAYARMDHEGITDWQFLGTENRPDTVTSKVINEELLYNAALGTRFDLVAGVNFFKEESSSDGYNTTARGTSTFNSGNGGAANGNGYAGIYRIASQATEQTANSWGVFSSLTWHITDKLNFTGGLRGSYDKKEVDYLRRMGSGPTGTGGPAPNDFIINYPGVPAGTTSVPVHGEDSWKVLDWRATVDYHLTQDIMAYATASKAFKSGQFAYTVVGNLSPAVQDSLITPVDPEKVINMEAGLRTQWLDGRLRINPTGYWMAWTNRQAARQQPCAAGDLSCPAGFRIITVNSGDIDVYGVEVDAQLAVTRSLRFDAAFGTTHYRLKDPVANGGPYMYPAQPTPTWNVGATYALPETGIGEFALSLNYAHQGPQQTYPGSTTTPAATTDSSYELPSYGLLNARVQLTTSGGRNVISLYANNLTDETYATYATRFGGGFWDAGGPAPTGRAIPPRSALQWTMGRPREYGLTFQHNF